jgi:hypothetical protein
LAASHRAGRTFDDAWERAVRACPPPPDAMPRRAVDRDRSPLQVVQDRCAQWWQWADARRASSSPSTFPSCDRWMAEQAHKRDDVAVIDEADELAVDRRQWEERVAGWRAAHNGVDPASTRQLEHWEREQNSPAHRVRQLRDHGIEIRSDDAKRGRDDLTRERVDPSGPDEPPSVTWADVDRRLERQREAPAPKLVAPHIDGWALPHDLDDPDTVFVDGAALTEVAEMGIDLNDPNAEEWLTFISEQGTADVIGREVRARVSIPDPLAVACPICGAFAHEPCHGLRNTVATLDEPHRARGCHRTRPARHVLHVARRRSNLGHRA